MKITDILAVMGLAVATGAVVNYVIAPAVERQQAADADAAEPSTTPTLSVASDPRDGMGSGAASLRKRDDGHYWASANVDGTLVEFMVDTGASTVALTYRDAQRLGLNPEDLDYSWRIRTAGGEVMGASVLLASIKIGLVEVEQVEAMVLRDGLTQSLLGMTFLGELQSYEFNRDNLILRQ